MVAIITGKGVGLERSSAWVLGSNGQIGPPSQGRAGEDVFVNAATGNLVITRQDEFLIGRGPDASIDRTYNSQGDLSDDNGDNWRMGVYRKVTGLSGTYGAAGSTVKRIDWDGSDTLYTWNATYIDATHGAYVATDGEGAYDMLVRASGVWSWTDGTTQITESYDDNNGGRITARTDTDGNGLTYSYTGNLITRVTNSNGTATDDYTDMVYGGTGGNQLLKLETHAGGTLTRVYYTYDAYNRLIQVKVNLNPTDNSDTSGTNYTTTYTYTDTTGKRVASISQSDGSLIQVSYVLVGSTYKVAALSQRAGWGFDRVTTFTYQTDSTIVTDTLGQRTALYYDANKNLTRIVHPLDTMGVPRIHSFTYNSNGDLTSASLGPNDMITYTYDARGNLLIESDRAGNNVIRTYDSKNHVLTERRYVAQYTTTGETGTPMTTRYAYDTLGHLRYVVTPEGFVTEHKYETNPANLGHGQRIATIDYAANAYNVSGLAYNATISESALNTWVAGIADKSTTRRTQFEYDYRGNLAAEKSYSKLLSTGLFDTSSELSQTTYVYDQAGNLLSKLVNGSTATETFLYDGLNRIVSSTDFNNVTTTVAFNDAARTTIVSLANGLVQTSLFGYAGELLTYTESGAGISAGNSFIYDALSRLVVKYDALWQPEIYFYDALGQKVASVDSDGSVTEYRYDPRGNLSSTTAYASRLSAEMVASLADDPTAYPLAEVIPLASADDRWTWNVYDDAHRLVQTIDGTGATTIYAYDAASRLVSTKQYATPLSASVLAGLKAAAVPQNILLIEDEQDWGWSAPGLTVTSAGWIDGYAAYKFTGNGSYDAVDTIEEIPGYTGDVLTMSASMMAVGTNTTHDFGIWTDWESPYEWGFAMDVVILSGPGTLTKLSGGQYRISGLSTTEATRIAMVRTFTSDQLIRPRFWLAEWNAQQMQHYTGGLSMILAGPVMTRTQVGVTYVPATDAVNDRVTRNFYDRDGRLTGTLDAEGYLTQIVYDKAGRKIQTIAYSGATGTTYRASGTFAQLLGSVTVDNARDVRKYFVYDARGMLRAEIDGEGDLTRYAYTPLGDVSQIVTGQKLDPATLLTTPPTFANLPAAPSGTVLETISYTRNHYGQPLTETKSLTGSTSTVTTYVYDSMRRLVSTTTQSGGPDSRIESRRYDLRGRLTRELSGIGSALLAALGPNPDEELSEPIWTEYATLYGYDDADRLVARVDANGARTLYYYDADDRLAYQVDALGEVVEYRYDAFGARTDTIVYAARIDIETFVEMTGGAAADVASIVAALANPLLDQRSTALFDLAGRTRASRDPIGNVTLYAYNSFGEVVSETAPLESGIAAPAIVTPDFSFEAPETGTGATYNPTVSGVTFASKSGVVGNGSSWGFAAAPDGDQVAFVQSNSTGTGAITMTVTGLNAGTVYQFSFMVAKRASVAANPLLVTVDGQVLGYMTPSSTSFTQINLGPFQATSGSATITFSGTQSSTEKMSAIDKVIVTQAPIVPHTSFETPEVNSGSQYNPSIGMATFESKAGVAGNGSSWGFAAAPDGDQVAFLQSNSGGTGSISEKLTNLIPGRSYQLSFYLAKRSGANANPVTVSVDGVVLGTFTPGSTSFAQFTASAFQATGTTATLTFSGAASATEQVSALDKLALVQLASNSLLTSYSYDRRGQVKTQIVDAAAGGKAITTTYGYDAFGRAVQLTDPAGEVTATAYDRAGRVLSATDALDGVTSFTYDARGNLVAVTDALNHVTRYVYDHGGREIFAVDALGGVVETSYDGDGRVLATRAYANAIFVSGLELAAADVTAQLVADSGDRITRNAYDKDGRLRFTVDGTRGLTEYRYDDAGNRVRTIRHTWSAQSSTYTMDALQAEVDAHENDPKRVSRAIYDAAGRMTFTIDPVGNVVAFSYDSAGRVIKQVAFVTAYQGGDEPLDEAMRDWATTNAHADDRVGRAVYDRKGRLVYSIDAEGFVTEYRYNKRDSVVKEIRYADPYAVADGATPASLAAQIGTLPWSAIVTDFVYDSAGRLNETVDGLGHRTVMTLDQRGQILSSTIAYGTGDAVTTTFVYDELGRTLSETHAAGTAEEQTTTYAYDVLGELVSTTHAAGTAAEWITTQSYDALGRLKREMSGIGSALLAALGPNPDPELADPIWAEYAIQYGYDTAGRLVARSDERGGRTLYYYDAADRLAFEVDALGDVLEHRYNALGDCIEIIRYAARIDGQTFSEMVGGDVADIAGIVAALADASLDEAGQFEFNLDGTLQRSTDPLGAQTTYVYNSFGEIALRSDPFNAGTTIQTSFDYDRRGHLITQVVDAAAGGKAITTTYGYDAFGRPFLLIDPNDQYTITSYDQNGRVVATTDALDNSTYFTYDARGNLVAVEDPMGQVTRYVYDRADRRIFAVDALGGVVETSYDEAGRAVATRAYATAIPVYGLSYEIAAADVTEQLIADAGDRITRNAYDKDGRLRFTVDGTLGLTEYRYDDAGNRLRTIGYGWTVSSSSTWTMDDLQAEVDAHATDPQRVSRAVYDAAGRMTFTIDAAGNVTAFSYDSAGKVIKQVAFVTAYQGGDEPLDEVMRDWATTNAHADDRVGRAVYDRKGRLVYSIDAEGFVTEYRYNKRDNVVKEIRYADPYAVADGATPAAMAALLPSSVPASAIVTDFVYDSAGRLAEMVDGLGHRTVMTLDQRGQILSSTIAYGTDDAVTTTRSYDALGRLESETRADGTAEEQTTIYAYDALGDLVSITHAAGTAAEWTTTRSYDALGRLKREMSGIGSALLAALGSWPDPELADPIWAEYATQFGYDTAGRMVARSDAVGARTLYYYDTVGRLVYEVDAKGVVVEYRYNPLGDRTYTIRYAARIDAETFSEMVGGDAVDIAGAVNALADAALDERMAATFDSAGRVILNAGQLGTYTAYSYNSFGEVELLRVALGESATPGVATEIETSFAYDRRGKLETQIVDAAAGGKAITTSHAYDAFGREILLTDPENHPLTTDYDEAGRILSTTDALENTTFFTYDARGNLVAVKDALNNVTRYVYDHADRLIFTVDALGGVVETSYDGDDQVLVSRAYAGSISTIGLDLQITAGDVTAQLVASSSDRITRNAYDKDGRLRFTVDGVSGLTEYRYDDVGHRVRTIRYDWAVSSASTYTMEDLQAEVDAHAADPMRTTRAVYDAAGRMAFAIDATGNVTAFTHDSAGRVVKQTALTTVYEGGDEPLADVMQDWVAANPHPDDRISRAVYDRDGRLVYSIDAEEFVTEYRYNRQGDVILQIRYADPVSVADGATPASVAALLPSSVPQSAITTEYFYDSAGRLEKTRDALLNWTVMTLDQRGQILSTTVAYGTSDASTTTRSYDELGRLQTETRADGTAEEQTTAYGYNALGDLVSITHAVGTSAEWLTMRKYDGLGRLKGELSGIGSALVAALGPNPDDEPIWAEYGTLFSYDTAGHLTVRSDANGARTLFYYDTADRLVYQVDALGGVVEYRYNRLGDRTDTIRYAARIGFETLSGMTGGRAADAAATVAALADPSLDEKTVANYDAAGRLAREAGQLGGYTAYSYNSFGEVELRKVALAESGSPGVATEIETSFVYDRRGSLKTEIVDSALGGKAITTGHDYDAFGREILLTDPDSRDTETEYDEAGRIVGLTDALDNTTSLTYDARGNVVAVKDALNHVTRYVYDRADRLIFTVDALGGVVATSYDGDERVTATRAYADAISLAGFGLQITAADVTGRLSADDDDRITRNAYDKDGRLRFAVDGVSGLTEYRYDDVGNAIRTIHYGWTVSPASTYTMEDLQAQVAAHAADPMRVTRAVHDALGRVAFAIDATGNVTAFAYDSAGRVIKQTALATVYEGGGDPLADAMRDWAAAHPHPDDRVSRAVYDRDGRLVYSIDAESFVTEYRYNRQGDVILQIRYADPVSVADGATPASVAALLPSSVPQSAITTEYFYDSAGRLEKTRDALLNWTVMTLDQRGQILSTTVAHGTSDASTTTRSYDELGRLETETRAAGAAEASTTVYGYNALGELETITYAAGTTDECVTTRTYDAAGRLKTETRADGTAEEVTTVYGYNAFGDLESVTAAAGTVDEQVTTRVYDALGRVESETVADGSAVEATTAYVYNAFGNVAKITDPRLNSGYFYYDARDRLILQVDPEGYVTKSVYGLGDEPTSVTRYATRMEGATLAAPPEIIADPDDDATTIFDYDKLDRLTDVTDAEGHGEHYELDAQGKRIQIVNKLNGVIDNVYDLLGRLKTQIVHANVHDGNGTLVATAIQTDFDYDKRGNLKTKTEGVGLGADTRVTGYAYDKLDRLIEIDRPDIVSVTVGAFMQPVTMEMKDSFSYDRRGNVIASQVAGAPKTYSYYDHLNRKTDEIDQSGMLSHWDYDANGNVKGHKVYGDAAPFAGTRPAAPPSPVNAANFRETHFTYDKANRLETSFGAALTTGRWDGDSYDFATGAVVRHFEYDAAGNAIRDYVGDVETRSFYDKLGRKIAELDAEHYLTVWELDAEGNVLVETRHANQANGAIAQNASIQALHAAAGSSGDDRITVYTYDRNGRRETETRLDVAVSTTVAGVLATTLHAASQVRYEYNGFGQVTRKVEANGDETLFTYDGFGRLTRTEAPGFAGHLGPSVRPTTDNLFDAYGNVVRTALNDPNGAAGDARVTSYVYNKMGWLASMTQQIDATLSTSHSYTYDAGGRIVWDQYDRRQSDGSNSPDSIVSTYDVSGRLLSQTAATRITTPPATPQWGFGDVTRFKYNVFGEMIGRGINFGADGQPLYQETFDYDEGGRLWRSTEGGSGRIMFYDALGNATLTLGSAGANVGALSFAAAKGSILSGSGDTNIADAVTTIGLFDKRGLQTATIEPDRQLSSGGATVTIASSRTLNAFGETTSETDARNNTTLLFYNTMGRLIRKESPEVSWTNEVGTQANVHPTEHYFYDVSGRLVAVTDASGHTVRRNLLAGTGHDGTDALVTVEYHADDTKVQTFYDVFKDARISRNEYWIDNSPNNDPVKTDVLMAYDKLGRLIQVQHLGRLLTETFTYDQLGQRTGHSMNALTETTDYDRQGRVVKQVAFGGDTTIYTYGWDGTLTTPTLTGTLGNLGGWLKTTINIAASVDATETLDCFSRTIARSDFGDHGYAHSYDWAGRMTSMAGPGETLSYTYLNSGRLASISNGAGSSTAFGYDKSGNETSEVTYKSYQLVQNATATWDALGRMSSWAEAGTTTLPAASILYEYDRVGNIRRQKASFQRLDGAGNPTGFLPSQDNWYLYDVMDRVTRDRGILVAVVNGELKSGDDARGIGTIQRQQPGVLTALNRLGEIGYDYEYDEAGRRKSMAMSKVRYEGGFPQNAFFREHKEMYDYYADGSLWKVRWVDGAETGFANSTTITVPPATGTGTLLSEFTRDPFGRTTSQTDWLTATVRGFSRTGITYNDKGQILSETVTNLASENNADALYVNQITNTYGTGADYRLGAVVSSTSTVTRNNSAHSTATTTNTYQWRDAPVITTVQIHTSRQVGGVTDYTTNYNYGAASDLTFVDIHDGRPRNVNFINDMAGQVIRRDETGGTSSGAPHEIWYRFGGKQMGQVSNNGTLDNDYQQSLTYRQIWLGDSEGLGAFRFGGNTPKTYVDFSQSQSPINSYEQGGAGGSYIVRSGDSLRSIAATLWGNADLWYKLAEANGLSGSSVLVEGSSLTIPPGVVSNAHNADTFRPYDAAKALGDLSPSAQKPPPKPRGCGMIGQLIIMAIAIAITLIIKAPVAQFITRALQTAVGLSAAAAGAVGAVVGAAVTGAVASAVSQGVGVATGLQEKFSWKGVALSALSAGVTEGFAQAAGAIATSAARAAAAANTSVSTAGKVAAYLAGKSIGAQIIRGVVTDVATQGIAVVTGLQKKFDWAGIAANAAESAVGALAQKHLGRLGVARLDSEILSDWAGGLAKAGTRAAITGTSFGDNVRAVLPGVIANTIGLVIEDARARSHAQAAAPAAAAAPGAANAAPAMELPEDFPGEPLPGETPEQFDERRIAFIRRRTGLRPVSPAAGDQPRPMGSTMETTGTESGTHYEIAPGGTNPFTNMLLDAVARRDIAGVLAAYKAQILPSLETAAGRVAIDLQGDGPSMMVMRDLIVSHSVIRTQEQYAAVTEYVAETDRGILRYIENQRPIFVTGVRPREHSWKDNRNLYFPISYRDMEGAFRAARRGWQGVEQRHWEYRRAQNVAHPEARNSHFVEDVGATLIFRGVGLVLGVGDAALHPAQTAENLAWLPARAIEAALVAENTPARVHLRNLADNIANADAIDWAQFTGNRLFDLATLAPAFRVARAGELAPIGEVAAREVSTLRLGAAPAAATIDDLARLEAAAAGRTTVAAPAGARVSSTAAAREGSRPLAQGAAAADSSAARAGSAAAPALGRATTATAAASAPVRAAAPAATPVVLDVGVSSSRLTLAAPRMVGMERIGGTISVRAAPIQFRAPLAAAPAYIAGAPAYVRGLTIGPVVRPPLPTMGARIAPRAPLAAAERRGADIVARRPAILSDTSLSAGDLAYLRRQFARKEASILRAADRGELVFSPGTKGVRIESLQAAYRDAVAARYERMYGKPLDLSRFNADHPVDLIIGGSPTQPLRMLNESLNKSVGSSLRQAAKRAGLQPGDPIWSVIFR